VNVTSAREEQEAALGVPRTQQRKSRSQLRRFFCPVFLALVLILRLCSAGYELKTYDIHSHSMAMRIPKVVLAALALGLLFLLYTYTSSKRSDKISKSDNAASYALLFDFRYFSTPLFLETESFS